MNNIVERAYYTDAEILAMMRGMAGMVAKNARDLPCVFFPLGGGGARDFKYFKDFLEGVEHTQRNIDFTLRREEGYRRAGRITDEDERLVLPEHMNPYDGAAVAIPFESTLKSEANDLVSSLLYIGEGAKRHGFEQIYIAATRDHLGIANAVCISQYEKFVGVKDFIKEHHAHAYDELGEAGALDIISDVSPEEIDMQDIDTVGRPGIIRTIGGALRLWQRRPGYGQRARGVVRRVVRR